MLQGRVDDERSNDDEKQGVIRENQCITLFITNWWLEQD